MTNRDQASEGASEVGSRKAVDFRKMEKKCEAAADFLKLLAHPDRLKILCCLSQGEKTAGELVDSCGSSQSLTSQFLQRLKEDGMLDSRKDGRWVRYRSRDPKVTQVLTALAAVFCR